MPSENFTPRSDEEPHPLLLLNMIHWSELFEREANRIRKVLERQSAAAWTCWFHIGSGALR